jgi:hypothetical protein
MHSPYTGGHEGGCGLIDHPGGNQPIVSLEVHHRPARHLAKELLSGFCLRDRETQLPQLRLQLLYVLALHPER